MAILRKDSISRSTIARTASLSVALCSYGILPKRAAAQTLTATDCPITTLQTGSLTVGESYLCTITNSGRFTGSINNLGSTVNNGSIQGTYYGSWNNQGSLTNNNDIVLGYAGYLTNTGFIENRGTFRDSGYSNFTNAVGATFYNNGGSFATNAITLNEGTIITNGDFETGFLRSTGTVLVQNNGSINRISTDGQLTVEQGGYAGRVTSRESADILNYGRIRIGGGGIGGDGRTNAGKFTNHGEMEFFPAAISFNYFSGELKNYGSVKVEASIRLTSTSDIENHGNIIIPNQGSLGVNPTPSATFKQLTGSTLVNGNMVITDAEFLGGTLTGDGVVRSPLANSDFTSSTFIIGEEAIVKPGETIGSLLLESDVDFFGDLEIDILDINNSDLLAVDGDIHLAASAQLIFHIVNGSNIQNGDEFTFLTADNIFGSASNVSVSGLGSELTYRINDFTSGQLSVTFTAVPVPATAWLFLSSLTGLLLYKRKLAK